MGDFVWQQTAPPPKDNNVKKKDNWKKVEEMEDYLEHQEEVQKDLLRLDVYFQSMTMTFVMEEPKYSVRTMAFCISIVFSLLSRFRPMSCFVTWVAVCLYFWAFH